MLNVNEVTSDDGGERLVFWSHQPVAGYLSAMKPLRSSTGQTGEFECKMSGNAQLSEASLSHGHGNVQRAAVFFCRRQAACRQKETCCKRHEFSLFSGDYTCVATNTVGQCSTMGELHVQGEEGRKLGNRYILKQGKNSREKTREKLLPLETRFWV